MSLEASVGIFTYPSTCSMRAGLALGTMSSVTISKPVRKFAVSTCARIPLATSVSIFRCAFCEGVAPLAAGMLRICTRSGSMAMVTRVARVFLPAS